MLRLLAFWLLLSEVLAFAQEISAAPDLSLYEGQPIVDIELVGRPEMDAQELERLRSIVKQQVGNSFDPVHVQNGLAALRQTGSFQNVELHIYPERNGVRLSLLLQPAYYIGRYDFPGAVNSSFSYSRLLQVSSFPIQQPYSRLIIERSESNLAAHFRREGFFQSNVRTDLHLDPGNHLVNVDFSTQLNERAKFGKTNIAGVSPEEAASLQHSLTTFWARLRGVSVRPGSTYSYRRLQRATQYLQRRLIGRHLLSARVRLSDSNYSHERNQADVSFVVTPGPVIRIEVIGARVRRRVLRRLVPIYQTNLFNRELVNEGEQNLTSYFQSKGYFDVEVHGEITEGAHETNVLYRIAKHRRGRVAEVQITGNQYFSSESLGQFLVVRRARFFSRGEFNQVLMRSTVRNLERVYRNAGFSNVTIAPELSRRDGNMAVAFHVAEGPQDIVESLQIEGSSLPLTQLAPKGLHVNTGEPYSPFLASQDRNEIIAQYLRLGYPTVSFRATADPIAPGSSKMHVVYRITEGNRVSTAKVITVGRRQSQQSLVDRTVKIEPGSPLNQEEILSAESRLYNLGVFDWAEIDSRRPLNQQREEDLVIKLHEANRNSISTNFGFEVINRGGNIPNGTVAIPGIPPVGIPATFTTAEKTFWGPIASLTYTRRNLRGMADTFSATAFAGRLDQRGSATYTVPSFRNNSWAASATGLFEHTSENPVYTARVGQGVAELRKDLNASKSKTLFLRYTFSGTYITELLIPELVPPQGRFVRLSTLSAAYARDTRDFPLDARRGTYQSFEVDFNPLWLGSNANFVRLLGEVAHYKDIGAGIIWANNVRVGLEHPFGDSTVPLTAQFFTGGSNTLRGFPLNGAGPQKTIPVCSNPADPLTCTHIQVPTGGNQLFILNSELRIPVPLKKGLGIAVFYDGGNVFRTIGFHNFWDTYSNTVGGGLRYSTPVGPIRLDIGHNLSPIPGIKATQVFLTLGQAF